MVGEVIADRYELEELVGSGGMSSVFKARDRLLDRHVALKVLHEHYADDGEYVERFRRDARAVAQLSHPNIVTVIDRGESDGRQFIVFEYIDGENLKELLEHEGPLPVRDALELAQGVARGLAFAHDHGLVHRDVKPQNVLLNGDGRPKVTDFGIARSLDIEHGVTQTGTVLGTSNYIAPEQASGGPVDTQTDVYSLGVLLFELLTGEVPFGGDNFVAVAMRHINEPPPSVRERRPDVSPRVDGAIRKAMAKEPRDRFASMDELCHELSACIEPETAVSAAETMVVAPRGRPRGRRRAARPGARPGGRRPAVWPLLLLLAGLAVLAGIFAAVFAFTDSGGKLSNIVGRGGGATGGPVRLTGITPYDPDGDQQEHDDVVADATDRDPATFWSTEHYGSFTKDGVGLVLDAGSPKKLATLTVTSDTPGFTAQIEAGSSSSGPFAPISNSRVVARRTQFSLRGTARRYYVLWITDLGTSDQVRIAEVTARGS